MLVASSFPWQKKWGLGALGCRDVLQLVCSDEQRYEVVYWGVGVGARQTHSVPDPEPASPHL